MNRRYQVVTWSSDIGTDERTDFTKKADAIADAKQYRDTEEYAAVYDSHTKTATVIFGNPFTPVFREYVKIIKNKAPSSAPTPDRAAPKLTNHD